MSKEHRRHHHHKDSVTRLVERRLNAIALRNKMEKWLRILLTVVAIALVLTVIVIYIL